MTETVSAGQESPSLEEGLVEHVAKAIFQSRVSQVIDAISEREFDFDRASRFFQSCRTESDRALPVLVFSFIDETMKDLLTEELSPRTIGGLKTLFSPFGPLGTASARIKILSALNWVDQQTARDADTLREIRNRFAHDPFVSFSDQSVSDLLNNIRHLEEAPLALPKFAPIDPSKLSLRTLYTIRAAMVFARVVSELICAPTSIRMGLPPGIALAQGYDKGPPILRQAMRWSAETLFSVLGFVPAKSPKE